MPIYFKKQAQIKAQSGAQIRALLFNEILTEIPAKYSNYSNVFSVKNAVKFPENIGINKHTIKLEEGKQSKRK